MGISDHEEFKFQFSTCIYYVSSFEFFDLLPDCFGIEQKLKCGLVCQSTNTSWSQVVSKWITTYSQNPLRRNTKQWRWVKLLSFHFRLSSVTLKMNRQAKDWRDRKAHLHVRRRILKRYRKWSSYSIPSHLWKIIPVN